MLSFITFAVTFGTLEITGHTAHAQQKRARQFRASVVKPLYNDPQCTWMLNKPNIGNFPVGKGDDCEGCPSISATVSCSNSPENAYNCVPLYLCCSASFYVPFPINDFDFYDCENVISFNSKCGAQSIYLDLFNIKAPINNGNIWQLTVGYYTGSNCSGQPLGDTTTILWQNGAPYPPQ